MLQRAEEEIKRQLDENGFIYVDKNGFISNEKEPRKSKINPETGEETTRMKPHRVYSWYHNNNLRLLAEEKAMKRRFPGFVLSKTDKGLTWTGYLCPNGWASYRIALIYPPNFPYSAPNVWVIEPIIRSTKHQLPDGHLCLFSNDDGTWKTNTTAVTILGITATWLWSFEYHQKHCGCSITPCKLWPGEERA